MTRPCPHCGSLVDALRRSCPTCAALRIPAQALPEPWTAAQAAWLVAVAVQMDQYLAKERKS